MEGLNDVTKNPETYEEAVTGKQSAEWKKAMDYEMASLRENKTWELTQLSEGTNHYPASGFFV